MCVIVSRGGAILGYTLANDVSAWDIERDNLLYFKATRPTTAASRAWPTIVAIDDVAERDAASKSR